MQVILLDKVANLGNLGDKVNVKAGYARNFLIPQGKSVLATKQNIAYFEARRAELEEKLSAGLQEAEEKAAEVMALGRVIITSKVGNEGKLFGSIGTRDIADAIKALNIDVSKSQVRLPHGVLRTVGEHEISLQFHSDVFAKIVIEIVAEV